MKILIGISGKRYIKPDEQEKVALELQKHIDSILAKYNIKEFTGLSALACGADSIFADLVINQYKQPLIAILPFAVSEYESDFTNNADLEKFKAQLAEASEIKIINEEKTFNQQQRTKCYFDAGKAIVDKTAHVIFVWDGLPPVGEGGTGDMLGYFSTKHEFSEQNIIMVSPAEKDVFFNELESSYKEADEKAIAARNSHTLVWKGALIFGCAAVVVFAINAGFNVKGIWALFCACAELLLVAMALGLIRVAKKKKFHENYLSQRILAEKLRLLKANYQIGNTVKVSTITYTNDKKLGQIIKTINKSVLKDSYRSVWFADFVLKKIINEQKAYHDEKINQIGKKHKSGEAINNGIGVILILVILLHVILKLHEFFDERHPLVKATADHVAQHIFDPEHFLTFLSVLLPGVYAAVEGWLFFENWEITQKFSRKIYDNLNYCQKTLPSLLKATDLAQCRDVQNQSLQLLTNLMLTDNTNWLTILEDKANYHWVF